MRILDLPVEVLLLIYHRLGDIDDALHLARTCKQLTSILDCPFSRVNIFRSIIQTQPQHQHDVQLTVLQNLNQTYSSSLDPTTDSARYISRPCPDVLNNALFPTRQPQLSDDDVWGIVSRWHGLRSLFALYTNSTIHDLYLGDWSPWWHAQSPLLDHDPLPHLSEPTLHLDNGHYHHNSTDPLLYRRFYKSLTSHWLSIELLSLAKHTIYPSPESQEHWHALVHAHYSQRHQRVPLRDQLDILHVALFLWEFLARKLFESIPLLPRLQEFRKRKVFLRPPGLIHAFVLLEWPVPDSVLDPMGLLERLTPEFGVEPAVAVFGIEGNSGGFENERRWDMSLQDLESAVLECLRGRKRAMPRATWRSFWPASWAGSAKWVQAGSDRLDVGVLDRVFRSGESDERALLDLLD